MDLIMAPLRAFQVAFDKHQHEDTTARHASERRQNNARTRRSDASDEEVEVMLQLAQDVRALEQQQKTLPPHQNKTRPTVFEEVAENTNNNNKSKSNEQCEPFFESRDNHPMTLRLQPEEHEREIETQKQTRRGRYTSSHLSQHPTTKLHHSEVNGESPQLCLLRNILYRFKGPLLTSAALHGLGLAATVGSAYMLSHFLTWLFDYSAAAYAMQQQDFYAFIALQQQQRQQPQTTTILTPQSTSTSTTAPSSSATSSSSSMPPLPPASDGVLFAVLVGALLLVGVVCEGFATTIALRVMVRLQRALSAMICEALHAAPTAVLEARSNEKQERNANNKSTDNKSSNAQLIECTAGKPPTLSAPLLGPREARRLLDTALPQLMEIGGKRLHLFWSTPLLAAGATYLLVQWVSWAGAAVLFLILFSYTYLIPAVLREGKIADVVKILAAARSQKVAAVLENMAVLRANGWLQTLLLPVPVPSGSDPRAHTAEGVGSTTSATTTAAAARRDEESALRRQTFAKTVIVWASNLNSHLVEMSFVTIVFYTPPMLLHSAGGASSLFTAGNIFPANVLCGYLRGAVTYMPLSLLNIRTFLQIIADCEALLEAFSSSSSSSNNCHSSPSTSSFKTSSSSSSFLSSTGEPSNRRLPPSTVPTTITTTTTTTITHCEHRSDDLHQHKTTRDETSSNNTRNTKVGAGQEEAAVKVEENKPPMWCFALSLDSPQPAHFQQEEENYHHLEEQQSKHMQQQPCETISLSSSSSSNANTSSNDKWCHPNVITTTTHNTNCNNNVTCTNNNIGTSAANSSTSNTVCTTATNGTMSATIESSTTTTLSPLSNNNDKYQSINTCINHADTSSAAHTRTDNTSITATHTITTHTCNHTHPNYHINLDKTLYLPRHAIIAVTGPTGCGKSALLKLLAGEDVSHYFSLNSSASTTTTTTSTTSIVTPSRKGNTHNNNNNNNKIRRNGRSVYVAQDGFVFDGTIAENICGGERAGDRTGHKEIQTDAATAKTETEEHHDEYHRVEALMTICGMDMNKFSPDSIVSSTTLSGGERLRISLARALFSSAETVLLDEPVSALDPDIAEDFIGDVLAPLRALRLKTFIIATNHPRITGITGVNDGRGDDDDDDASLSTSTNNNTRHKTAKNTTTISSPSVAAQDTASTSRSVPPPLVFGGSGIADFCFDMRQRPFSLVQTTTNNTDYDNGTHTPQHQYHKDPAQENDDGRNSDSDESVEEDDVKLFDATKNPMLLESDSNPQSPLQVFPTFADIATTAAKTSREELGIRRKFSDAILPAPLIVDAPSSPQSNAANNPVYNPSPSVAWSSSLCCVTSASSPNNTSSAHEVSFLESGPSPLHPHPPQPQPRSSVSLVDSSGGSSGGSFASIENLLLLRRRLSQQQLHNNGSTSPSFSAGPSRRVSVYALPSAHKIGDDETDISNNKSGSSFDDGASAAFMCGGGGGDSNPSSPNAPLSVTKARPPPTPFGLRGGVSDTSLITIPTTETEEGDRTMRDALEKIQRASKKSNDEGIHEFVKETDLARTATSKVTSDATIGNREDDSSSDLVTGAWFLVQSTPWYLLAALLLLGCWRTAAYASERALADAIARSPFLGRYDRLSQKDTFLVSLVANALTLLCFVVMCVPLVGAAGHLQHTLFRHLALSIQQASFAAHAGLMRSGRLLSATGAGIAAVDGVIIPLTLTLVFAFMFAFYGFIVVYALPPAALGVGLLAAISTGLTVAYLRVSDALHAKQCRLQDTTGRLQSLVTERALDVRCHNLSALLRERLIFSESRTLRMALVSGCWARWTEMMIDATVAVFCGGFCLYATFDTIALLHSDGLDYSSSSSASYASRAAPISLPTLQDRLSRLSTACFGAMALKVVVTPLAFEATTLVHALRLIGAAVATSIALRRAPDPFDGSKPEEGNRARIKGEKCINDHQTNKGEDQRCPAKSMVRGVFQVNNLWMRYGNITTGEVAMDNAPSDCVLRGLTLPPIPLGSMTLIRGPSGCGKSSLFLALLGLYRLLKEQPHGEESVKDALASSVSLSYSRSAVTAAVDSATPNNASIEKQNTVTDPDSCDGKENKPTTNDEVSATLTDADWRRHLLWVPQEAFLVEGTILENVVFPRLSSTSKPLEDSFWRPLCRELLDALDLPALRPDDRVTARGANLSGGERQRLGIARALATLILQTRKTTKVPERLVLLMDEPTSFLEPAACRKVLRVIRRVACEQVGAAVLLISHQNDDALAVVDLCVTLGHGRVLHSYKTKK